MIDTNDEMERISFSLNRFFYDYLIRVDFDEEEVKFVEELFKKIDILIKERDLETYKKVEDFIIFKGLPHRMKKFLKNKEKLILNENINKSNEILR